MERIDQGNIDMGKMIEMYKKIKPCLHPKMNSRKEIDWSAWFYSLNRLPNNVLDTFVFVLMNKPPDALFSQD